MKRKTIAKLLGAALTLTMAGASAQAMTSVYEDGNRTVYIYRGEKSLVDSSVLNDGDTQGMSYVIESYGEDEDEVSYTVTYEGEEEANVILVQDGELPDDAVIEESVTYEISDEELEAGGYYEYTIVANGDDESAETKSIVIVSGDEEDVAYTVTEAEEIDSAEVVDALLAELETVGITSNEETGELFYEGQSIRWLLDEQNEEDCVIMKMDGGEINVFTVRDAQGNLTGVKAAE